MTEHSTGLPTLFRGSASDTPAPLPRHLSCAQARPARSAAPANCRKVQQWTQTGNLAARLACHQQGHGARLIAVITQAGIGFVLARTIPGDRHKERAIKNAGGAVRYCPICTTKPRNGRWS